MCQRPSANQLLLDLQSSGHLGLLLSPAHYLISLFGCLYFTLLSAFPRSRPPIIMSEGDTYAPQSPDLSGYHSTHIPARSPTYGLPPQSQPQQGYPTRYPSTYQAPAHTGPLSPYQGRYSSHSPANFTSNTMPRRPRADTEVDDEWAPGPSVPSSGRKSKKAKVEEDFGKSAPGADKGIEVKTKFPVARIKRIMQADEDVGKVAQVTPTAVCE